MIRVVKPSAPERLSLGTALTDSDCSAYEAEYVDYMAGTAKFDFQRNVYGHASVKDTLKTAQHAKCCFCEGRFDAHNHGDVEHYRPKRAVRQSRKTKASYPGYYWLVYSWENLYYSCSICNSRKSTFSR